MSNHFQVIQANNSDNNDILASMHALRYQVFHQELKWTAGMQIRDDREYDAYDLPDTHYLVRVNGQGDVDASCRLMPTSKPYMLDEHYASFVDPKIMPMPHSDDIWEITRFCSSKEAREEKASNVTGQIVAAAIEFGLKYQIKNYVALATDWVMPVIRRFVGWDPMPLGALGQTPDDACYAVRYTVSFPMLQKIRAKNDIKNYLLFDMRDNKNTITGENDGSVQDETPGSAANQNEKSQPPKRNGSEFGLS